MAISEFKNKNNQLFIGLDISLNHSGLVVLGKDTTVVDWFYLTVERTRFLSTKEQKVHGFLLEKYNPNIHKSKEVYDEIRKNAHIDFLREVLLNKLGLVTMKQRENTYIAIEQYAWAGISGSKYQIGELGGCIKHKLFEMGFKMRYVAPTSLKVWVGKGNYKKRDIVEQAVKLGFTVPLDVRLILEKKNGDYDGVGTDLADAFFLARLVRAEVLFRSGDIQLSDLPGRQSEVLLKTVFEHPSKAPKDSFLRPYVEKV